LANTRSQSTLEASVLTGRQQEIWDFLVDYVDRHGYPPTVREIGERVGLASPSTVHAHLANLERAGISARPDEAARARAHGPAPPRRSRCPEETAAGAAARRRDRAPAARCSPRRTSRSTGLPEQLVGAADFSPR
jgi:SOS-response transcriptional repressor LexA